jgi:DNA modification methylase
MKIAELPQRAIADLIPYAKNARTHSEAQIAQIAASIKEFGWTNPVLVDGSNGVVAGHGRIRAAQLLGIDRVPVLELAGLSAAQRKAYILADNKLAMNAGWDDGLLSDELAALRSEGFDLSTIGFSDDEALRLMGYPSGLVDENEVPELPTEAVSCASDIWTLGRHRLLCGDATSLPDVGAVLAGVRPHLMVTDPPYGVAYDANWRNEAERANGKPYGARAVGLVPGDDRIDWSAAWALFPGEVAYVWHADRHAAAVQQSLEFCKLEIRCQVIWAKSRFVISRGDYHWQHEPCWYAVRKGCSGHWHGDRSQTTLWQIDHLKSETGHSAQKPVECMRRPIENNSSHGQAVYDPFVGSGTTIIAAEQAGRACLAIELSPAYVDVSVMRWQNFTGERATLENDGRTFEEIRAERRPTAVPAE